MMRVYSVHERAGRPIDGAGIVFVREGFSFAALFFTVFWLGFHRLWLALVLYIVAAVAIAGLGDLIGLSGEANMVASLALQVLLGIEAQDIRRWTLARNGYREIAIATGDGLEQAERDFFRQWDGAATMPVTTYPAAGGPAVGGAVWPRRAAQDEHGPIGIFPPAGG